MYSCIYVGILPNRRCRDMVELGEVKLGVWTTGNSSVVTLPTDLLEAIGGYSGGSVVLRIERFVPARFSVGGTYSEWAYQYFRGRDMGRFLPPPRERFEVEYEGRTLTCYVDNNRRIKGVGLFFIEHTRGKLRSAVLVVVRPRKKFRIEYACECHPAGTDRTTNSG